MPTGIGRFGVGVERCVSAQAGAPSVDTTSPRYDFPPRRSNPPPANALRLNEAPGG